MLELSCLKPMEYLCMDCCGLFCGKIWSIFQIVVLSLLFCFQVEACQPAKVLLADSLVDGSASADSLSIVVSSIRPPVCLCFDISNDHVFNRYR